MSIQACVWAARQRTDSPARKLTLLILADHLADGQGFVNLDHLAEVTELPVAKTRREISALANLGLITTALDDGGLRVQLQFDVERR